MNLTFAARIEGAEIHCQIGSDIALQAPVFCFSLMAAARAVSGGILIKSVAGYAEMALPDLSPGMPATFVIAYADPNYAPRNRAWLPLGPYLRVGARTLPLPPLPAGVRSVQRQPASVPEGLLRLVPQPTEWQPRAGALDLESLRSDHPVLLRADTLACRVGLPVLVAENGIDLSIIKADLAPEAYELMIDTDGVSLRAATDHGIFNAAMTLISLRQTYNGVIPCGTIIDEPRFVWRGQHLDCARHFYSVETILRLLDLMALFKLNRFHWHFADDEAFRLEVDCVPDLWRKTAFRGEGCVVPGVFGGGIRSGGSYSKDDVAQIIARAADLHIAVLPEIEIPAHAFAINKAVPGLRDQGDNGAEVSVQGYSDNVINPAIPGTWDFLQPLCLEVARLFPIGILHLGCDELPHGAWDGSAAVKALKMQHGLNDRDDVQGWMMHRLAGFLAENGIRSAAWEEAAKGGNGGIGHGATLFSWTGQGPGIEAARRGHDVVMCPAQHTYFDHAHSKDPDDWGATWAGILGLEQTVNWSAVPKGAEDVADRIIGVQGCFWSEFTTDDAQLEQMLAPRMLGVANKAWDRNDSVDGKTLRRLVAVYERFFDCIGWRQHSGA